MPNHVIEIVTFKLADGISPEAFVAASGAVTAFARSQAGFVSRRLSMAEDGTWMDHVHWSSMEAAQAAQTAFPAQESLAPFMAMINPEGMTMTHHALMDTV